MNLRSAKVLAESMYSNFSANRFDECLSKQSKEQIDEVSEYTTIKVIFLFFFYIKCDTMVNFTYVPMFLVNECSLQLSKVGIINKSSNSLWSISSV